MQFNGFEIKDYIVNALKDLNFKNLTDIQKEVLRTKTKNVLAQSKTGSGKTHAFLIPIFNDLDETQNQVQSVIVAPTKELSRQIYKFATHIASFSEKKIDIRLYQGGEERTTEIERLKTQPMIVIGTPGRLHDLVVKEKALFIYTAKYFIVDEADMTFDTGFMNDVCAMKEIASNAKIMVFSATIHEEVKKLIFKLIDNVEVVKMIDDSNQITHTLLKIRNEDKLESFLSLTKCINPYLALVFLNTKERATNLFNELKKQKLNICLLHGGLDQRERKRIMKEIQALRYQYIICSDIASRGIDIEGVSHVINYDLPSDYEFYIHRTGRTGRASFTGHAYSLYDFDNKEYLSQIEAKGITFLYQVIKDGELVDYVKKPRIDRPKKNTRNTPRYLRK